MPGVYGGEVIGPRAYNSNHQMLLAEDVQPARLIIVDSVTAYFRSGYVGHCILANRQQKLNKNLHSLVRFADLNNALIVATHQVMANPDNFFGDPTNHVGGQGPGHAATFRLHLRKSKDEKSIVRLVNSPDGEAVFSVTTPEIED